MGLLQRWGCEVRVAENGIQALEALEEALPDMILMDVQMPEMDGYDTTRKIRQLNDHRSKIPIIAMTAATSASTRRRILGSGMQDVIQKPINIEELRAKIGAAIESEMNFVVIHRADLSYMPE